MFAGKYPERTIKAVYLDAIFDREGLVAMRKRGAPPELNPPETKPMDSKRRRALELMAENEAHTDYKQIKSPVLAFVVVGLPTNMVERFKTLPEPRRKVIDEFLREPMIKAHFRQSEAKFGLLCKVYFRYSMLIRDEDDDTAYIQFTSFTHPTEIFESSIKTGTRPTSTSPRSPTPPRSSRHPSRRARPRPGSRRTCRSIHRALRSSRSRSCRRTRRACRCSSCAPRPSRRTGARRSS